MRLSTSYVDPHGSRLYPGNFWTVNSFAKQQWTLLSWVIMKSLQGVSANRECFLIIDQQISIKTKHKGIGPGSLFYRGWPNCAALHTQNSFSNKKLRDFPQSFKTKEELLQQKKRKETLNLHWAPWRKAVIMMSTKWLLPSQKYVHSPWNQPFDTFWMPQE